jgi:hypothetical protein
MIVIKIEMWPHGDREQAYPLGGLIITNDGTGDQTTGNYRVEATHSGAYFGKRPEPYKTGHVKGFRRSLSVYRLVCRCLQAIRET